MAQIGIGTLIGEAETAGWDAAPWRGAADQNRLDRSESVVAQFGRGGTPVAAGQHCEVLATSLLTLPHLLSAEQAVAEANRFVGFTPDWGGKPTYFRVDSVGCAHPCSRDDLRNILANRFVQAADGRRVPVFTVWNSSSGRREVAAVCYDPTGRKTNEVGEPI